MENKYFYERIKLLVSQNGGSALQFAKKCGISPKSVEKYLHSEGGVTLNTLMKISKACNVDVSFLVGENSDKSAESIFKEGVSSEEKIQEFSENFSKLMDKGALIKKTIDLLESKSIYAAILTMNIEIFYRFHLMEKHLENK